MRGFVTAAPLMLGTYQSDARHARTHLRRTLPCLAADEAGPRRRDLPGDRRAGRPGGDHQGRPRRGGLPGRAATARARSERVARGPQPVADAALAFRAPGRLGLPGYTVRLRDHARVAAAKRAALAGGSLRARAMRAPRARGGARSRR